MKLVKGLLFATALGAVFTSCSEDEEVSVVTLADSRQSGSTSITIKGNNIDGDAYAEKTLDLNYLIGEDNYTVVEESDSITYDYNDDNDPVKFVYSTQHFAIKLRQDQIFDPETELEEENAQENEQIQEQMEQNGYLEVELHVNTYVGGINGASQKDVEGEVTANYSAGSFSEQFDTPILDHVEFQVFENDGFNYWEADKTFNELNEDPYVNGDSWEDMGYGIRVVDGSFSYDETTHQIKFQLETINEDPEVESNSVVDITVDTEIFKNYQYSKRVAQ